MTYGNRSEPLQCTVLKSKRILVLGVSDNSGYSLSYFADGTAFFPPLILFVDFLKLNTREAYAPDKECQVYRSLEHCTLLWYCEPWLTVVVTTIDQIASRSDIGLSGVQEKSRLAAPSSDD